MGNLFSINIQIFYPITLAIDVYDSDLYAENNIHALGAAILMSDNGVWLDLYFHTWNAKIGLFFMA